MTDFPGAPGPHNTVFQPPRSGMNNVAEFQASGLPFSKEINFTTSVTQVDFPFVTMELYVKNRGAGPLAVGWTENGVQGENKYTLLQNEAVTLKMRVKSLFLVGVSGSGPADVTAAMTSISHIQYPTATGSFADSNTGEFGYNSGSVERAWGWNGIG